MRLALERTAALPIRCASLAWRSAARRTGAPLASVRSNYAAQSQMTTSMSMNRSQLSFCPARNMSTTPVLRQESGQEEAGEREMDSGEKDIHDILTREFQPKQLQVQDVSGGCGSFYAIVIVSSRFKGIPTVKAHRMVNESLKDIIKGIHGLQLRTMAADD